MRSFSIIIMLAATLGCGGSSPGMRGAPVSVTGKLLLAGQPVGDVAVSFQPLDSGHMKSLPVKPDGTFQGELVTGTYAYAIVASSSASQSVLGRLAPQYLEPNLDRIVKIQPDQELQITLD